MEVLKFFKPTDFQATRGIFGTRFRQRSASRSMSDSTRTEYQRWQSQSQSQVRSRTQTEPVSSVNKDQIAASTRQKSPSQPVTNNEFKRLLEQKLQSRSISQAQFQTQPNANSIRNASPDQIATSEQVKAFELLGKFYNSRVNQKDESRKFGVQSTPEFHGKKAAVLGDVKVLLKKQVCPDLRGDANLAEILTCPDNKTAPSLLQRAMVGFYGAGQINGVSYYAPVRRLFLSEFYRYMPTGTRNRPEYKPVKMDSPPCSTLTKENVEQLHLTLDEKAALKGACPNIKY